MIGQAVEASNCKTDEDEIMSLMTVVIDALSDIENKMIEHSVFYGHR